MNSHSKKIILVTGKPGSGKSTISERAASQLKDCYYFSIGNELRAIALHGKPSRFSEELKQFATELKEHKPVPPHLAINVFEECVAATPETLLIVDGYPQYPDRLPPFYASLSKVDAEIVVIYEIDVTDAIAKDRLASRKQRLADVEEDDRYIASRLQSYYDNMVPTIHVLVQQYPVHTIDGSQAIDTVLGYFMKALSRLPLRPN